MAAALPPHQPNCLGCGPQNPGSMGLSLHADGGRVKGLVTLDRRHEGAPGFAHGGAVATVLDDALGSLLMLIEVPAVTARLEVDYRAPAFLGREFRVEAWLESREGRKLWLGGAISDAGESIADASGLFVQVDGAHFLRGAANLPKDWRRAADPDRGEEIDLPW